MASGTRTTMLAASLMPPPVLRDRWSRRGRPPPISSRADGLHRDTGAGHGNVNDGEDRGTGGDGRRGAQSWVDRLWSSILERTGLGGAGRAEARRDGAAAAVAELPPLERAKRLAEALLSERG